MTGYDVNIECLSHVGSLDLRGGESIRRICGESLGVTLPASANTLVSVDDQHVAYCISSDHWILQVADGSQQSALQTLESAVGEISHSFVDVSDMYSRIRLTGPEARVVLSQGVSIDIHPRVFTAGNTARVGFAKTTAQLHCTNEAPTFVITVFSSYRQYALDWLHTAAGKS
jgi:sarcosine oxidase subunit gamma